MLYQPPIEHLSASHPLSEPLNRPGLISPPFQCQTTSPRSLRHPLLESAPESESNASNDSDDSEPGDFPALNQHRIKTKEQRRREREVSNTGPRTKKQRKRDDNLNRGSLADIHPDHQPLVSNAIDIYSRSGPLGLEPAKPLARIAMRRASADDGTLLLKPNRLVIRLVSIRFYDGVSSIVLSSIIDGRLEHKYLQALRQNGSTTNAKLLWISQSARRASCRDQPGEPRRTALQWSIPGGGM